MAYTNSFLTRGIAMARTAIDEPDTNAKYSDSLIVDMLEQSYAQILGEINRNTQTPVVARVVITLATGTFAYVLPYTIGSIYAIYEETTYGQKVFYDANSRHNPLGRLIWIEGNTLHIQSSYTFVTGTEITVEYIPSGTARLHNGTCTVNAAGDEITFVTTNAGTLDTHVNAYAGCIIRIIDVTGVNATGNYTQERTVVAYNTETGIATLDVALDPIPVAGDGGAIFYEIAPTIYMGLDMVISLYTAYTIASIEGNQKRAGAILNIYRNQLRNLRLNAFYSNLQQASQLRGDTYNNRRYRKI